ncbi:hypothetical protein [Niabella beijingensis]|uniref:hypothetical protein n=1 Tax=Niabella beijingensis TaxID=2872700 RepID=UPI001CBC4EEB|nr:hypothetical protein [Niabella beijingensis]MBZ4190435.1 hypothetical protein [Niabella beijingensis]
MGRKILAGLLLGLGILTATFFKYYNGTVIPYRSVFLIAGMVMSVSGLLLFRSAPSAKEFREQQRLLKLLKDLKATGERIQVDLTACELKEHSFYEEKQRYGHENPLLSFGFEQDIQAWNALGGQGIRNVKQVQTKQTVLLFERQNPMTGKTEKFISQIVPKDRVTLQFYLDQQKTTTLYVDRENRTLYYFDLDFLKE